MAPRHNPADVMIIDQAVALGCLAPVYDRDHHEALFQCWEARALAVLASKDRPGHAARVADADLFCGQPPHAENRAFDIIERGLTELVTSSFRSVPA